MALHGARLVVPIDLKKKPREQKLPLHNRWHPDIPLVAEVKVGEVFRVEMVDWSGGGVTKEYTAEDIKYADLSVGPTAHELLWLWVPTHFSRRPSCSDTNRLAYISFSSKLPLYPSMAPLTPRLGVPIDLRRKPWEQKQHLHNRWHPEIPPVAEVKTAEVFKIEMLDWTGGAIKDDRENYTYIANICRLII
ncbi:unnamed protein product [Ilex paraguariensis]|uniref:Formamidase n=1 Tax=Ilex paraguariensis TaxID=185542 RepID=A0ABC8RGE6_9AQUA